MHQLELENVVLLSNNYFNFKYQSVQPQKAAVTETLHHIPSGERTCKIFFKAATTHCGFVFCSPLAGYSLLAYEVS